MKKRDMILITALLCSSLLTGCGQASVETAASVSSTSTDTVDALLDTTEAEAVPEEAVQVDDVEVRFGSSKAYTLHTEDNVTALGLLQALGDRDLNLPIYNYEDFEGCEFYQFYDIPSRYEVTGNPAPVSSEQAGQVYYEEPNRLLLFFRDAEIEGEYTLVGTIDADEDFTQVVEKNEVVPGWGNKIISVRRVSR